MLLGALLLLCAAASCSAQNETTDPNIPFFGRTIQVCTSSYAPSELGHGSAVPVRSGPGLAHPGPRLSPCAREWQLQVTATGAACLQRWSARAQGASPSVAVAADTDVCVPRAQWSSAGTGLSNCMMATKLRWGLSSLFFRHQKGRKPDGLAGRAGGRPGCCHAASRLMVLSADLVPCPMLQMFKNVADKLGWKPEYLNWWGLFVAAERLWPRTAGRIVGAVAY